MSNAAPDRLGAYALFAGLLASAGLPLYIHAPKFYVDEYGVSLAALGSVLFGLRLLDVVQDPLLGQLAARLGAYRGTSVALGAGVLAAGMLGLFAIDPPVAPLVWFALTLTLVFSGFSFLTITYYAQGVAKADRLPGQGHLRLARWRETGALLGVCLAAIAPAVLMPVTDAPFAAFALGFALVALTSVWAMRAEWTAATVAGAGGLRDVLGDTVARRLLLVALVNAAPVAVTSTLFLFFVESRLNAPGLEGPLLLVFFLSAAVAAPLWGKLAEARGARSVLVAAMVLSIAAFGFVLLLGPGDTLAFGLICVVSGAALGADLTILPALFANRMAQIAPGGAQGFGLWSFVSKFTLAFAAVTLLPVLEASGFEAGTANDPAALSTLTLLYAGVPCILKLAAIALLAATPLKGG